MAVTMSDLEDSAERAQAGAEHASPVKGDILAASSQESRDPIDRRAYADAIEMLGAAETQTFLAKLATRLRAAGEFVRMERDDIAPEAHILISEAGMLGFYTLAGICRSLETACRGGKPVAPLLAAFDVQKEAALTKIQALQRYERRLHSVAETLTARPGD